MSHPGKQNFDPFHKWLGIRKKKGAMTHYDLLGISLDEDDIEVIKSAVEQRMQFIESKRGEGHDRAVTTLINLLQEAEMTLLDPEMRRDYDRSMNLFHKRSKRRQVRYFSRLTVFVVGFLTGLPLSNYSCAQEATIFDQVLNQAATNYPLALRTTEIDKEMFALKSKINLAKSGFPIGPDDVEKPLKIGEFEEPEAFLKRQNIAKEASNASRTAKLNDWESQHQNLLKERNNLTKKAGSNTLVRFFPFTAAGQGILYTAQFNGSLPYFNRKTMSFENVVLGDDTPIETKYHLDKNIIGRFTFPGNQVNFRAKTLNNAQTFKDRLESGELSYRCVFEPDVKHVEYPIVKKQAELKSEFEPGNMAANLLKAIIVRSVAESLSVDANHPAILIPSELLLPNRRVFKSTVIPPEIQNGIRFHITMNLLSVEVIDKQGRSVEGISVISPSRLRRLECLSPVKGDDNQPIIARGDSLLQIENIPLRSGSHARKVVNNSTSKSLQVTFRDWRSKTVKKVIVRKQDIKDGKFRDCWRDSVVPKYLASLEDPDIKPLEYDRHDKSYQVQAISPDRNYAIVRRPFLKGDLGYYSNGGKTLRRGSEQIIVDTETGIRLGAAGVRDWPEFKNYSPYCFSPDNQFLFFVGYSKLGCIHIPSGKRHYLEPFLCSDGLLPVKNGIVAFGSKGDRRPEYVISFFNFETQKTLSKKIELANTYITRSVVSNQNGLIAVQFGRLHGKNSSLTSKAVDTVEVYKLNSLKRLVRHESPGLIKQLPDGRVNQTEKIQDIRFSEGDELLEILTRRTSFTGTPGKFEKNEQNLIIKTTLKNNRSTETVAGEKEKFEIPTGQNFPEFDASMETIPFRF